MFEDSLVESTGRIRTRSKWFAIGSFLLQASGEPVEVETTINVVFKLSE